jgi:hypothetical protein
LPLRCLGPRPGGFLGRVRRPDSLNETRDLEILSGTFDLHGLLVVAGDEVFHRLGVPAADVEDLCLASNLSFLLAKVFHEF